MEPITPQADQEAAQLDDEATANGLSDAQYRRKMQRRKEVQAQRLAQRIDKKGLIIINTGNGKGNNNIHNINLLPRRPLLYHSSRDQRHV
jgi:cob(I)alamin adenosyltransferase